MNDLIKVAFATHYHYLLKAQNFHWNVSGPDFLELHQLFELIYNDVEEHTDEFAEHIRAVGEKVPASFKHLTELSKLEDPLDDLTTTEMLECLYKDNTYIVKCLVDLYKTSELNREYGLSGFISERMAAHRKHGWQLYSSLTM